MKIKNKQIIIIFIKEILGPKIIDIGKKYKCTVKIINNILVDHK